MTETTQLSPESRVSVAPSVYARAFGEEIVLLDFARGEYFGLDEVGAEVWRGVEKGHPLGDIADHIVARFDVARDRALADVLAIVGEMRDRTLVCTTI